MRIGVFICHCGSNIPGTVDCPTVAEQARISSRSPALTTASAQARAKWIRNR